MLSSLNIKGTSQEMPAGNIMSSAFTQLISVGFKFMHNLKKLCTTHALSFLCTSAATIQPIILELVMLECNSVATIWRKCVVGPCINSRVTLQSYVVTEH